MAFHFAQHGTVSAAWIPGFYAVAMAVDALAALAFGRLFDRVGLAVLVVVALLTSLFSPLVFFGVFGTALVGVALWGVGIGAQESVMRAAVAGLAPPERRGLAFGLFNAWYWVAWLAGSALMGWLYDASPTSLVAFSVATQLAAVLLLLLAGRALRSGAATR